MRAIRVPIMPSVRTFAAAALAVACATTAVAQTPSAAPSAIPTATPGPRGFTAQAHATGTAVMSGRTVTANVRLAVAQRAALVRVDVLSLTSDAFAIPPVTATLVIDHAARTVTAWSDSTHRFHVQKIEVPSMIAAATPAPRPSVSPRPRPSRSPSPRQRAPSHSFLRDLDVLQMTVRLVGHTTTAGEATSGLAFDFQVAKHGDAATSHVTATMQLADDFAFFPMTLDVAVEPGTAPFSAKLAYAVDSLVRGVPPASQFVVPAGYTDAGSMLGVVFTPMRHRSATPAPAATALPAPPAPSSSPGVR
jgi:hypothetical protein